MFIVCSLECVITFPFSRDWVLRSEWVINNALDIFIPICHRPRIAFFFIVRICKLSLDFAILILVLVGVSFAWKFVVTACGEQQLVVSISMGIFAPLGIGLNIRGILEMSFKTGTPT
jgi:hypothetical protein